MQCVLTKINVITKCILSKKDRIYPINIRSLHKAKPNSPVYFDQKDATYPYESNLT